MGTPRHNKRANLRRAKAELLLELARCYAFGTAGESDVLKAAAEYGDSLRGAGTEDITNEDIR